MTSRGKMVFNWFLGFVILMVGVMPVEVLAGGEMLENLQLFGDDLGLGNADLMAVITELLRSVLSFLGVALLIIVLYGGFLYMLSGGAEEKTAKARQVIVNGLIGVVIIWCSFSLVNYVFAHLAE